MAAGTAFQDEKSVTEPSVDREEAVSTDTAERHSTESDAQDTAPVNGSEHPLSSGRPDPAHASSSAASKNEEHDATRTDDARVHDDCGSGNGQRMAPSTPDLKEEAPDCRICLDGDNQETMVCPCACTGSLKYTHFTCLQTWAKERQSLTCEICETKYKPEVVAKFEQDIKNITERPQPGAPRENVVIVNIGGGSSAPADQPRKPRLRLLLAAVGVVLALIAFLYFGLYTSDVSTMSPFVSGILRMAVFMLPLVLVVHLVIYCHARHRQALDRSRGGAV